MFTPFILNDNSLKTMSNLHKPLSFYNASHKLLTFPPLATCLREMKFDDKV